MPTPPWPRALIGDTDWQQAARDIWDALAGLDTEYGEAALPASPSMWVQRGHEALVLIADEDADVSIGGLDQLQSCLDALDGVFHPAQGAVPGGWVQDLLAARAGLAQLRGLLGGT